MNNPNAKQWPKSSGLGNVVTQLAIKHWPEEENAYLSPNYSFQAAASGCLAGLSSLKRKIGTGDCFNDPC